MPDSEAKVAVRKQLAQGLRELLSDKGYDTRMDVDSAFHIRVYDGKRAFVFNVIVQ